MMRKTILLFLLVMWLLPRPSSSGDDQFPIAGEAGPVLESAESISSAAQEAGGSLQATAGDSHALGQSEQVIEPSGAEDELSETPDDADGWHHVESAEPDVSAEEPIETPLTPDQLALRNRIRQCLAYFYRRPESIHRRSPWGVMHAIVGFGVDTPLHTGDRSVNAIAWLCANAPCSGMRLLYRQNGLPQVRMGPGYQGHKGQLLCILAQSRVKIDYPLVVDGQRMTVADLVKYEQVTCRAGTELSFKLIGLSHYLSTDAVWQNELGQAWDIERLLAEELAQPIVGACCGGTHRLTGFAYAVRKRQRSGQPATGQWQRAEAYLNDYHEYTFKLQNADGSFSTNWFAQRGEWGDLNRRLNTTGHTLEWLVYSLPEPQLDDPRLVRAVSYLTELMWQYRGHNWEIGPKGHAIHALSLYDERRFGGTPGQRAVELAQVETDTAVRGPLVSRAAAGEDDPSSGHPLPSAESSGGENRGGAGRWRRRFR